jgi:large-conductance mechanosensitive channel
MNILRPSQISIPHAFCTSKYKNAVIKYGCLTNKIIHLMRISIDFFIFFPVKEVKRKETR